MYGHKAEYLHLPPTIITSLSLPVYVSFTPSSHSGLLIPPETQHHTSLMSLLKCLKRGLASPPYIKWHTHPPYALTLLCFFHNTYRWLTLWFICLPQLGYKFI